MKLCNDLRNILGFCIIFSVYLMFFRDSTFATEVELESNYVFDKANWIEEQMEVDLNKWLSGYNLTSETEIVVVTLAEAELPAIEVMEQEAMQISDEKGFGDFEEEKYGSVFLFINQVPTTKEVKTAVVPTWREKINFTPYQTSYIARQLDEEYLKKADLPTLMDFFVEWLKVYYYPVINEMGLNFFPSGLIEDSSKEIAAWRNKYEQNIILLLNKGFAPGLYEKYADDYFISQGYGVGEQASGVFLIFDDTSARFDIRFYGTASKQYTQEQLDDLIKEIALELEKYDILNVIYTIERFLDSDVDIPLEEVSDDSNEFLSDGLFYVQDAQDILTSEEERLLERRANLFSVMFDDNTISTYIMSLENLTETEMTEALDKIFKQEHGNSASGLAVLFDAVEQQMVLQSFGDFEESISKNKKKFQKVVKYLQKQLEKEKYSHTAILRFQLSLMDFLAVMETKELAENYLIDEQLTFYEPDLEERISNIKKSGLQPFLIRKFTYYPFESSKQWLKQLQKMMVLSGFSDEMVLLAILTDNEELELAYFGKNNEVMKQIESKIDDELKAAYHAEEMQGAVNTFLTMLEEKVIPIMEKSASQEIDNEKKTVPSLATIIRNNSNYIWIVMLSGMSIVLIILILILVLTGKNKKKKDDMVITQQPYMPENSNYPQPNMGYSQANTGFIQSNAYPPQNSSYGQANPYPYPQPNTYGQSALYQGQSNMPSYSNVNQQGGYPFNSNSPAIYPDIDVNVGYMEAEKGTNGDYIQSNLAKNYESNENYDSSHGGEKTDSTSIDLSGYGNEGIPTREEVVYPEAVKESDVNTVNGSDN